MLSCKRFLAATIGVAVCGAPVFGQCVTQDFESYADGTLVGSVLPGISIEGYDLTGTCLSFPEALDLSGNTVVWSGSAGGGLCLSHPQDLVVHFTEPQSNVSLRAGAWTAGPVGITVRFYSTAAGFAGLVCEESLTVTSGVNPELVSCSSGTANIIRVTITAGSSAGELLDDLSYNDATPPTAEIQTPGLVECVDSIVSITGVSCDPDGTFDFDELHVQRIDPPDGDNWQLVGSFASPLCAPGTLYTWDTSSLVEGIYRLRLRVYNDCGGRSESYATVYLDKDFDEIDLRSPVPGEVYGGTVCFDGTMRDFKCFQDYTVEYAPAGSGSYAPVDPAEPVYTSHVTNDPFALWDSTAVPDGNYDLLLTGNTANNTRVEDPVQITIDNTPALASIDSPVMCEERDGIIQFIGTADDAHFKNYSLQYIGGTQRQWTTFWSGTSPVIDGLLGELHAEQLPACCYGVRLVVTTSVKHGCSLSRQTSHDYMTIRVGTDGTACPEDINGDGVVNLSDLAALIAAFGISCP